MIPEANVKDLMLKTKVVEAVREGRFHVFPVSHIEQGLEILTGKKAGKKKKDATYPRNTINFRVEERLNKLNEISRETAGKERTNEQEKKVASL
jgi:predicted ATP-dependent protease